MNRSLRLASVANIFALMAGPGFANTVSAECARINSVLWKQIAQRQIESAEHTVSQALTDDIGRLEPVCAALLSNNLASRLQLSGRLDEARAFAERALNSLQRVLPPDDHAYFAPLHILATLDLEQGLTGRAREVFLRMQNIRATEPQDRVRILFIGAVLLIREGNVQDAESRLRAALTALSEGGGGENSADAASLKGELAYVYLQERRYKEAAEILNTALSKLDRTDDEGSAVRVKLLHNRAAVWGYQGRWRDAEADLGEALSLCRQLSRMDPAELAPIVSDYAYVLRKMHRKQARSVERWATALRSAQVPPRHVVDVTELAPRFDQQ
jgi:tetratricopeptide (TPR) repeat protein